jgi:putative membrane protein
MYTLHTFAAFDSGDGLPMPLTLDLVLAVLHHLGILILVGCLAAELALLSLRADGRSAEILARIDLAYGLIAGAVLCFGLARVFWGARESGFYMENPVFWLKLGLFLLIALVSIRPTMTFIRWRRLARAGGGAPPATEIATTRRWVLLQAGLLLALPIFAALMARGIGL